MKRFISWLVLYLISLLTSILTSLVVGIGSYLLGLVNELNTFLRIVIYLFGGTTFISFLFLPVYYGSFFAITASEAVKGTKKGTRYYVFATYMLISNIIGIIIGLTESTFHISYVIMCVYYIALIVLGRELTSKGDEHLTTEKAK